MPAKIIVLTVMFWGFIALMTWAALKYGWPRYLEYRERKEKREHEQKMKELERDEKLVEQAEDEYWER